MKVLAALPLLLVPFLACGSTSKSPGFDPTDPADQGDGGTTGLGNSGPDGSAPVFDASVDSPFTGCASASYQAKQTPAAMLVVLDASGTMANANKYAFAEQALITAVDQDAFDGASLGLLLYPTGNVPGPACLAQDIGGIVIPAPQVTCKVSGLAQVPLAPAGVDKSNAQSGVRHAIYTQLSNSEPNKTGEGDGNPSYDALNVGIGALKGYPINGKRILLYITDGGASCTSLGSRPGYQDGNGCSDWEQPDSIVTLLKAAHDDATAPINSFVVGVPGADTTGQPACDPSNPDEVACGMPPYHVRNALSAYAYAGSPETVDPTCTGKTYAQSGGDPAVSCHFDMTQSYSAQQLADAINAIRGKVLGCVFDLPAPAGGGMIDKGKVNVTYSAGSGDDALYKRKDPSNACTTDGCWDYTTDGKVELFGKACVDLKTAPNAKVNIVVGCETQVK